MAAPTMDAVVALCKRRGLIFPASEIYGGIHNTYDYGHYGVLLKKNVVDAWWKSMIQERDDIVALDSAIIQHPRTWEASGHLAGFTDPLVQCLGKCKNRFREDHLREEQPEGELRCPVCGGELTEPRAFSLMFETSIGPVKDAGSTVYLRPETAQGIFLDFKTTLGFARRKPPFGIAQVGKSFRNEITPGNFIFRTLEFEQMEMEFFVPPDEAGRWYDYWRQARLDWYAELGIDRERLRLRDHDEDELSHYSSATADVEYLYPIGWSELEGVANRGDFDLTQHAEFSGEKLEYFDPQTRERYVPHVIEPAAGVGRTVLALLCDAYDEDEIGGEKRTVLRLHPRMAPVKVAVLPLLRKDGHPERAREIYEELRRHVSAEYDEGGHIGKRYRRQDEIGTPFAVTIDHQTLEDGTVTLRARDTLTQDRVPADELVARLNAERSVAFDDMVAADQVSYEDLYRRWEASNWRAWEIDFSEDRAQWQERFSAHERRAALWTYAMFFHGEDAVADDLSPFIDAAPREEQKYFLTTQQVDEARHAVFFNRFMHEVVERGDGTIASALEATRPELTWGFVKTFEMLHRVVDELRRDRSRTKLAQAVTMYHFVVEATLAQPGQHFISDYLAERDLLPGFRAGLHNVALDEQRHIGFGVKLLRDLALEDPEVPEAVAEQLRAVTPVSLAVFVPPGWDTSYVECFGFTLEQIYEEGARSFEAKFRAAGLPIEELPGPQIMPMDLPPADRARRGLDMLRAGYLGPPDGPPARDPEAMAMLFDSVRRNVDVRRAPDRPFVLQWEFPDAEPWHVRLDNGSTAAAPGRAEHVDVELRCRFEDWVDIVAGRLDPRRAVATGRLRPRAKPRTLWRARGLFSAS